jgi:hypothetical protein
MIRNYVFEKIEPEQRKIRQHRAFAGNGCGKDDIEGREPVCCDDEQTVFDSINISHLAAPEEAKIRHVRLSNEVNSRFSSREE